MMDFNPEIKKKVLEAFVTSAEDSIYALRCSIPSELLGAFSTYFLPEEVWGAFGSYFSRSPKDFRENLWDAITGKIDNFETEVTEESLMWVANRDFRQPYEVLQKGLKRAQQFYQTYYGKYSHKSIANTVWIPMVATNVSQMFAKDIAYDQLAFFIEQSTRFVRFDAENVYKDPDIMKSRYAETYVSTLEKMADCYYKLTDQAIEYYKRQFPYGSWLANQDETTQNKGDKAKIAKYEREIRGKALDISRFLLPQAVNTNIAWILDARSTEYDIAAWLGHPLQEMRDSAFLIRKHAGQIASSLLKHTEENMYYKEKLHNYYGDLAASPARAFDNGVEIIQYQEDSLDMCVAHLFHRHNVGGSFKQRLEEVKRFGFEKKIDILRRVTEGRGKHDEWVEMDEEFDIVKIAFEIRSDIGSIRDWRRHQKWDRSEPLYTLDNGYHKPDIINDMGKEASETFDRSINLAINSEKRLRQGFKHQAQYVVPMAANHPIVMSGGLDQLQYMLYTRSTSEGNFSYRYDAFNLAEASVRCLPWLLGYERYPKGKSFLEVYKDAPLKTILRLDVRETGLHQ